jgi:hypothetical protein
MAEQEPSIGLSSDWLTPKPIFSRLEIGKEPGTGVVLIGMGEIANDAPERSGFDLQAGGLQYTCTIADTPVAASPRFFWPTTGATATPTLPRATAPLCARSPSCTAPIPRSSGARSVATPMARRAARSVSRSISASEER